MILKGDCRETLKTLASESVSSIVTDPPYEIGFMGKGWDGSGVANDPELWAECFRVLKPGGHVLAFGAARTYHRMACAIEDAGFEIRDSLHWVYGSGFPKSHNVGNKLEEWQGWGTALKPAHEPIVMARKPFPGTVAQNVLEWGVGALNIDGTRIGSGGHLQWATPRGMGYSGDTNDPDSVATLATAGRWPANVILTHSTECKQIGESAETYGGGAKASSGFVSGYGGEGFAGTNGVSAVWKCMPDCPAREIDQQSGQSKSTGGRIGKKSQGSVTNVPAGIYEAGDPGFGDTGGASRYFAQPEWASGDYLTSIYTPKAGKRERNAGLDGMPEKPSRSAVGMQAVTAVNWGHPDATVYERKTSHTNPHPMAKPVALMRYLIRLVTPPGGTVLDPFLGSGTTAVAAILESFDWIGCELTAEYLPIIEARCQWARENIEIPEPTLFDGVTT